MNIITVVPITRQKVPPVLSYFTGEEVPVGAVVSVPLRSKQIQAIVAEKRAVEDMKTELRNAPYEIKKLGKVKSGAFFSGAFVDACRELAEWYATGTGTIMSTVLPDSIIENANKIAPPLPLQQSFLDGAPNPDETYAVQGDDSDRMSSWRSLIRQQFARKKSIVIYAPTVEDVRQIYASLEKGIEGYIFMLHGGLTKKKMLETWGQVAETKHSVVVVSTPIFSTLPRGDIESVVIERENGRGWMSLKAPYIDFRRVIETIARKERRTVFLSDSMLRVETLNRLDEHEISEGSPFKWRSISTASDLLINMRKDASEIDRSRSSESDEAKSAQPKFRVLSDELSDLIIRSRDENTHLFVMTGRRGLATVTVCDDCENIVACNNCGSPVVLHTSKQTGKNFFLCHSCGERRSADEPCSVCGGFRLSPLGIGSERVAEELRKNFPDVEVFQVDADTTTTEKQVTEVIDRWRQKPGSVLVGTETALLHMFGSVDHVAVASLDSLFALPDFRAQERLMYTLVRLRSIATRSIIVQTRRPDEKVFEYGLKGNLSDFYRSVLAERKRFDYPPFSLLIKITLEGKKETIAKEMGELQAHVMPYEIDVFPAYTATAKGTSLIHGLLKMPHRRWPDPELVEKLRSLPPDVSIKINPESLL